MRAHILAAMLAVMTPAVSSATTEIYPSRPITLICPFPPAGPLDTLGRVLAHFLQLSLGQLVVVENIAGANGSIGTGRSRKISSRLLCLGPPQAFWWPRRTCLRTI